MLGESVLSGTAEENHEHSVDMGLEVLMVVKMSILVFW
jgi:hypothetical protein